MQGRWAWMLVGMLAAGAAGTAAANPVLRDQAEVRGLSSGRLLYREVHYVARGAGERWVLYRCPDGRPFARKRVWETGPSTAPNFLLEDGRDGYREGVRGDGGTREVHAGLAQAGDAARSLAIPADGVIDAGFDAAVRRHWSTLLAGKPVDLKFLVPSRKQFFPVRVQRVADGGQGSTRTLRLRMKLATWFGFAVPDVNLVYGLDDRRLLVFSGTANVRDARGRNPQVRISFAPKPAAATADELERVQRLPLDGRCPF